jgi:hypothetical protein
METRPQGLGEWAVEEWCEANGRRLLSANAADGNGYHGPVGHDAPGEVAPSLMCNNWGCGHREELGIVPMGMTGW